MKRILILSTAILWSALPALADSGAEEGSANLFAGDVGNAIWTLVIFGLVIFVLGKFAWGPLLSGLQAREEFIRESLEQAKRDRESAARVLADYEAKIDAARAEATAIVEEGRRDAEVVKGRIESEARSEAEKMIARAKQEIGIARDTAIKELYLRSAGLATELAAKIVAKELDPNTHQALIDQAISELGRHGAQG